MRKRGVESLLGEEVPEEEIIQHHKIALEMADDLMDAFQEQELHAAPALLAVGVCVLRNILSLSLAADDGEATKHAAAMLTACINGAELSALRDDEDLRYDLELVKTMVGERIVTRNAQLH